MEVKVEARCGSGKRVMIDDERECEHCQRGFFFSPFFFLSHWRDKQLCVEKVKVIPGGLFFFFLKKKLLSAV